MTSDQRRTPVRRLITALLDWITTDICGPVTPSDDGLWF